MKKRFIAVTILSIFFLGFLVLKTEAQVVTPTPTNTDLQQKAQKLLELVASDAARLNLTEKRGIIGAVTDSASTQITVDDVHGNTRFIDVDELTKFSNPAAKGSFGISDIEKGQTIGVLGLYNKSSRRILARFVDVIILPRFIHGAVSTIDSENFSFGIVTDDNKKLDIDVETVTKTSSYTLDDGLIKSGFSKISQEESVIIIGYPDKKDASRIVSSQVILLPEIPKNPSINFPGSTSSGEIAPSTKTTTTSTGSGKTLTPIK